MESGKVDGVSETGVPVAAEQLGGFRLQLRDFIVGERRAVSQLVGALQRRGRVVLPNAGQIGMAIGTARRRRHLTVSGRRGLSGERDSGQRNRRDQSNEDLYARDTFSKHRTLLFLSISD